MDLGAGDLAPLAGPAAHGRLHRSGRTGAADSPHQAAPSRAGRTQVGLGRRPAGRVAGADRQLRRVPCRLHQGRGRHPADRGSAARLRGRADRRHPVRRHRRPGGRRTGPLGGADPAEAAVPAGRPRGLRQLRRAAQCRAEPGTRPRGGRDHPAGDPGYVSLCVPRVAVVTDIWRTGSGQWERCGEPPALPRSGWLEPTSTTRSCRLSAAG
jgi:hypothetical protein